MKNLNYVLLFSFLLFLIAGCSKDDYFDPALEESDLASSSLKAAKKPAPNLRGEVDLIFNLAFFNDMENEPTWIGTIDIEGYGEYDMSFFPTGEEKGFSQASPFEEDFHIYDQTTGVEVLGGYDAGVTTLANKPPEPNKYRMNGEIVVAIDPFEEEWIGRHVHMSGVITWDEATGAPATAKGPFRVN